MDPSIFNNKQFAKEMHELNTNPIAKARHQRQFEAIQRSITKDEKYWTLRQILLEAVKTGNQRDVSKAIKNGADVELWLITGLHPVIPHENDMASTFLGIAALHNHHHLIDCLLEAGIDIDSPGGTNKSPLHIAAERNYVDFARNLIQAGADMEEKTFDVAALAILVKAYFEKNMSYYDDFHRKNANCISSCYFHYRNLSICTAELELRSIDLLNVLWSRFCQISHMAASNLESEDMRGKHHNADFYIKVNFLKPKSFFGFIFRLKHLLQCIVNRGPEYYSQHSLKQFRIPRIPPYRKDIRKTLLGYSWKSIKRIAYYYPKIKEKVDFKAINSYYTSFYSTWKSPKSSNPFRANEHSLTSKKSGKKDGIIGQTVKTCQKVGISLKIHSYNLYLKKKAKSHECVVILFLKNHYFWRIMSIRGQNELYEKLLAVISSSDNVQEAARLLTQGAPLESYGRTSPSALAMAILWNRVMIMELLLAAGAPLTLLHHGKNLLQVAWFSTDVTIRVKTMIGRAYLNQLTWERDEKIKRPDTMGEIYVYIGLQELIKTLNGKTPWQARWSIDEELRSRLGSLSMMNNIPIPPLPKNVFGLSLQMGTAANHNCTLSVFFLHQVGGRANHRTGLGLTPLHEALDAKVYDLATIMVKHLGASLYIPDCNNRLPTDLMPVCMKQKLEKEQVAVEFNKFEKSILLMRSEAEKVEMKEIALIFVCLYATFTKQWDQAICKWQVLYRYLVSLIQVKSMPEMLELKSDVDVSSQFEDNTWIANICENLNQLNKENHIPDEESFIGLLDILSCIEELSESIRFNENMITSILPNKKYKIVNISTDKVLLKCVKLATENNFPVFLHLLFTIGQQSLNTPLNEIIKSLPLHHAASVGNFCSIVYLTLTCHASVNVLDRNGNTPAHLAYMNGYSYIGDYLCKYDQTIEMINNNAGQTPNKLKEAFKNYEKLYGIERDEYENDITMNLSEQIDGISLSTKLLEHWLSKTNSMSFRKIMEKSVVDYSCGEAKHVLTLVVDFTKRIGRKIAEYNPLLKGIIVPVGSAADNVRLNAPDENDCTWLLDWKNIRVHLDDMSKDAQKMSYKHIIRVESDNMEIQYLLKDTNLLEEFYAQSTKALSDLVPNLDPHLSLILPGIKRIGCGVCITLAWAGTTYPMMIITMDLVPAFKASRPINFPHPPLTKNKEDPRLNDIYVVQTHIKGGEKRCSTTLEEQFIMQQLSSGQRFVFIIAKLLVSKLKTEKWAPKKFKERFTFFSTKQFILPAPTGFLLKSAFFQELERVNNPEDWKENCIVDRLKGIFYCMCTFNSK
ncbi:unnamed protein product, partial [Meganyctiphanes norvegica]